MKIGLIAPPWVPVPPDGYGGTEAVVDRLARGFDAAGHDVLLCTTGDSTCPVPKHWTLSRSEGQRIGSAVPELRHVLGSYEALHDVDIVHDHTVMGPVYAAGREDLLVVTTNHGPFNDELIDIYRRVCDRVPIIAISHDQASRADGVTIAGVIHHGLDVEDFPIGAGAGDYYLFLGRMAPEKGARRAALVARRAGIPLKIAAKMREPLEHEFFHEQVRPLLTPDIEYVGEVGPHERAELLGGATALLNPIRWPEPFGLVMIEALACGTPVLAFREGAAPEIIEDGITGILCDDVSDMAGRVPDASSIERAACRASVETHFSTARMVDDHVTLFEHVLAHHGSS